MLGRAEEAGTPEARHRTAPERFYWFPQHSGIIFGAARLQKLHASPASHSHSFEAPELHLSFVSVVFDRGVLFVCLVSRLLLELCASQLHRKSFLSPTVSPAGAYNTQNGSRSSVQHMPSVIKSALGYTCLTKTTMYVPRVLFPS